MGVRQHATTQKTLISRRLFGVSSAENRELGFRCCTAANQARQRWHRVTLLSVVNGFINGNFGSSGFLRVCLTPYYNSSKTSRTLVEEIKLHLVLALDSWHSGIEAAALPKVRREGFGSGRTVPGAAGLASRAADDGITINVLTKISFCIGP